MEEENSIRKESNESEENKSEVNESEVNESEVNESEVNDANEADELDFEESELSEENESEVYETGVYETEVNESEINESEEYESEEYVSIQPKEDEPKMKKSRDEKRTSKILWLLLCALVGFASGIGGTMLTMILSRGSITKNSDVLYQSVIQTNADGEEVNDMSAEDIVANVKNSVVEITTSVTKTTLFLEQYVTSGAGSGVIFSKEGLIVTNHHVIENADDIQVRLANGEEYKAELIASDAQTDLAVLRIEANNLQPAVLGDSDNLNVGEDVLAIGNPLGSLGGTVTDGILSATDRDITIDGQSMTLLQTSAAINPGNSGGGLFNTRGELIGIVNAKSSGSDIEGLGFAIPINIAKNVVNDLVEKGKVSGRVSLGIKYYEISSITQALQYGVNTLGLLVSEVIPNSNAAAAGIQPNDIIIEADNKQITSSDDLKSVLSSHKVGDRMTFTVVRDKEYVELSCTLAE